MRTVSHNGGMVERSAVGRVVSLGLLLSIGLPCVAQKLALDVLNGKRPLLDAHNCYPYDGRFADRIDRALRTGFPVAIEQDIAWANDRPVVTHKAETDGSEPTLERYFFERVRPIVERALKENNQSSWPLIVVHFDFKDNREPLLRAVLALLERYGDWISTAVKDADPAKIEPLKTKPLLVLTEEPDIQQRVFFEELPVGAPLRIFGSAHTNLPQGKDKRESEHLLAATAPEQLMNKPATNYRRWWNLSWHTVEEGGQRQAGKWTGKDAERLNALVDHAHRLGYWIRFYTLDGFNATEGKNNGWFESYNFGSPAAVQVRWKAADKAGVDLVATDEYQELANWRTTKEAALR